MDCCVGFEDSCITLERDDMALENYRITLKVLDFEDRDMAVEHYYMTLDVVDFDNY